MAALYKNKQVVYLPESCQQYGVGVHCNKDWSPCGRMHLELGIYRFGTGNARVWCTEHAQ